MTSWSELSLNVIENHCSENDSAQCGFCSSLFNVNKILKNVKSVVEIAASCVFLAM